MIFCNNLMLPKRRFWKSEQKMKCAFSTWFSRMWVLDLGDEPLKSQSKLRISSFVFLPKSSFGEHKLYAPQTKILEVQTKIWERIFEVLSNERSQNLVLTLWNYFENAFPNVRSDFQNLRLGSIKLLQKIIASQENQHIASHATIFCNHLAKFMLPKRRFWNQNKTWNAHFRGTFKGCEC